MKHFTKEQISSISQILYDRTIDVSDPLFREAGISLITLGLESVGFKVNKAGQISKSDTKRLMGRLIFGVSHYNSNHYYSNKKYVIPAETSYSRLPIKTRVFVYNRVMQALMEGENVDLLAGIVCEHVDNNNLS